MPTQKHITASDRALQRNQFGESSVMPGTMAFSMYTRSRGYSSELTAAASQHQNVYAEGARASLSKGARGPSSVATSIYSNPASSQDIDEHERCNDRVRNDSIVPGLNANVAFYNDPNTGDHPDYGDLGDLYTVVGFPGVSERSSRPLRRVQQVRGVTFECEPSLRPGIAAQGWPLQSIGQQARLYIAEPPSDHHSAPVVQGAHIEGYPAIRQAPTWSRPEKEYRGDVRFREQPESYAMERYQKSSEDFALYYYSTGGKDHRGRSCV